MAEQEQDPFAGFEAFDPSVDAPTPQDPFEQFEPLEQPLSPASAAGAVASRGVGAFAQTAPIIPGAVMGARIGTLTPFPQFTVPLGAVVGGTAGFMFGDTLADMLERWGLATSSVDDLPPELRPFGAAGEVVGGSIPFMGAPLYAARVGYRFPSSFAGDFLNKVIEGAGKAPRFFTTVESLGIGGAAVAGGAAEHFAPGQPLIRAGAEVLGGFFHPGGLYTTAVRYTVPTLTNVIRRLSPAGRQTSAGRFLQEVIEAAGEDQDAIIRLLAQPEIPGLEQPAQTIAQKTGSRGLAALEADLKADNLKFGADLTRQTEDLFKAHTNAIRLLEGTGDPAALQAAADIRRSQYRLMIQSKVDTATRDAVAKASAITADTPAARSTLSKQVEEILDDTMKRVRAAERDLYAAVPHTPLTHTGYNRTLAKFASAKSELLSSEPLDPVLTAEIRRITDAKKTLQRAAVGKKVAPRELADAQTTFTTAEAVKLRSRALALARQAGKQDRDHDARLYGIIAEGILDDLERSGLAGPGTPLSAANQFSRELNDVFTRSFVGKIEEVGRRGAETMPPEVLMKRAFASGEELGSLQMRQIEEATRFLIDRQMGTPIDVNSWRTVLDAQERILRLAAAQSVEHNAKTGAVTGVNMDKLRTFLTKNEEIIQRFPEVKTSLEAAIKSEAGRTTLMAQVKRADAFLEKKAIVSKILDVESPIDAVRGALQSARPVAQINAMATLAKKSGPDAMQGLRAAMFEDAFRSAEKPGGGVSLPDLISALNDPIRPGAPSLLDIMGNTGLVSAQERSLLQQLVERGQRILSASAASPGGTELMEPVDTALDTAMRVAGSRAGSLFAGGRTGPQLIASAKGSQGLRQLLAKIPQLKQKQLIMNATRGDPEVPGGARYSLFELLLEKAGTPQQEEAIVRRIHAYGVQAGIFAGSYHIEGEEP